jgi:hypothetical protein
MYSRMIAGALASSATWCMVPTCSSTSGSEKSIMLRTISFSST